MVSNSSVEKILRILQENVERIGTNYFAYDYNDNITFTVTYTNDRPGVTIYIQNHTPYNGHHYLNADKIDDKNLAIEFDSIVKNIFEYLKEKKQNESLNRLKESLRIIDAEIPD